MCPTSPSVQSSMMIQTGFSVMTPISFTMWGWSNWRMVTAETETARGNRWAYLLSFLIKKKRSSHVRDGNLTSFLEELFPDAVRSRVLTGFDGHREGRVLLEDTWIKASDSLTISQVVLWIGKKNSKGTGFDKRPLINSCNFNIPGSCTPPGGHLQIAPRRCSVPTQCGRAGSHSHVLNTQHTRRHQHTHTHQTETPMMRQTNKHTNKT